MEKFKLLILIFLIASLSSYSVSQEKKDLKDFYKTKPKIENSKPKFYNGEVEITPFKGPYGNIGASNRYLIYEFEVLSIFISHVKNPGAYILQNTEKPGSTIYPDDITKINNEGDIFYYLTFRISSANLSKDKLSNFKIIYRNLPFHVSNEIKKEYTKTYKIDSVTDSSITRKIVFDSSTAFTDKEVLSGYEEEVTNEIIIYNFYVEVRERSHFKPGIGIFKSLLKSNNYELITDVNDPAHGQKVVNNGRNSTYGLTLGALYYPFGHDDKLFWDDDFKGQNILNMLALYIGIGVDSRERSFENFFFGAGISFFKLNFIAGIQYGREQNLKNGIRSDITYPANTFSDISKYLDSSEKFSFFYSLIIDAQIFRQIFSGF